MKELEIFMLSIGFIVIILLFLWFRVNRQFKEFTHSHNSSSKKVECLEMKIYEKINHLEQKIYNSNRKLEDKIDNIHSKFFHK